MRTPSRLQQILKSADQQTAPDAPSIAESPFAIAPIDDTTLRAMLGVITLRDLYRLLGGRAGSPENEVKLARGLVNRLGIEPAQFTNSNPVVSLALVRERLAAKCQEIQL